MKFSESVKNLAFALAKFQEEVRHPENSATNPQFRSKYAPLNVVINTVKPILAKNGLSFIQSTGAEGENIVVTTVLLHESGEFIESDPLVLPAYQIKKGGEKDFNAQGAGSAITYARRYSLSAILGLSSEDDDDGNGQNQGYKDASSNPPTSNNSQANNTDAEKRRQEAIARAQAKKSQQEQANTQPTANAQSSTPQPTDNVAVDNASQAQLKAINNLLHVISKKKHSFEKDAFLIDVLSGYGIAVTDIANPQDNLNELSSDQAKEVITRINAEMKA